MRIIYILLICLVIYYIIVQYYEKYIIQENFNSSLVPVSSIITFAKIAQKLVNGGTLLIPSHLQIGNIDGSETGNLNVTGNTIIGNGSGTVLTTVGSKENNGNLTIEGNLFNNKSNMNLSIAAIAGDAFINKLTVSDKTTITGTANINNGVTSANIKVNGAVSTNNMINTGDLSVNTSVIDYARVTGDIKDRGGIINSNYIKNDAGILKIVNTKQVTVTDPIDFGLSQRNGQYCKFNGQNYNTFNGQPFWFDFNFPACVPGTPRIETTKSDIKLYDDVIITGDLTINGTQNIIPRGMTMFWSGSSGTKPSGWSRMITNGRPFIVGAAGSSGVAAANATRYRTGYRYNIEAVWQSDGNGISTKTYGLYLLYKD